MGEDKATDDEGDKQGDGDDHNPVEERTRSLMAVWTSAR